MKFKVSIERMESMNKEGYPNYEEIYVQIVEYLDVPGLVTQVLRLSGGSDGNELDV